MQMNVDEAGACADLCPLGWSRRPSHGIELGIDLSSLSLTDGSKYPGQGWSEAVDGMRFGGLEEVVNGADQTFR